MMQNIEQFDKKIGNGIEEESIDLEEMISGDPEEEQTYGEKTKQTEEEDYLDEMSTDDLRKRNAFITDILEGKLSKKEIDELEDIQKSGIRMHKLDREKTQRDEYEEDGEPTEINMMKKQSHRVIEKNKVEAGGHIYRDCDYLSQEHQRRLEELLSGELEESPFDCNEMEFLRRRGIDEGIRTYRQLSHSVELG